MAITAQLPEAISDGDPNHELHHETLHTFWNSGRPWVDPHDYGATGDGTIHPLSDEYGSLAAAQVDYPNAVALTDSFDWAAIQLIMDGGSAWGESPVIRLRPTTYVPNRRWTWRAGAVAFTQAPQFWGAGMALTVIDSRVASGFTFDFGQSTTYCFGMDGCVRDLKITSTTSPTLCGGIRARGWSFAVIDHCDIGTGLTDDCVQFAGDNRDSDACFQVQISFCYLWRNEGWGIHCPDADPATSDGPPPAGGIGSYTGVNTGNIHVLNTHMLENKLGGARVQGIKWDFTNSYCEGCGWSLVGGANRGGIYIPLVANNGTFKGIAIKGCEFDRNVGQHIDIEAAIGGVTISEACNFISGTVAIYGSPYTGGSPFVGPAVAIKISKTTTGFTRGVKIDLPAFRLEDLSVKLFVIANTAIGTKIYEPSFTVGVSLADPAPAAATAPPVAVGLNDSGVATEYQYLGINFTPAGRFGPSSTTMVNGANNDFEFLGVPGRTMAATRNSWRINGPTGAFSLTGIVGGVDGREITLCNPTGQTLTIKHQDAGSTAGNKITCLGNTDVVVSGTQGCVKLIYNTAITSWIVTSNLN